MSLFIRKFRALKIRAKREDLPEKSSGSPDESDNRNNDRQDYQDMDRRPEKMQSEPADQPENEQDENNGPKHPDLSPATGLLSFPDFTTTARDAAIPVGKAVFSATVSLP
ncbi:MAG: hypothetical protein ACREIF_15840 [Chthoniobacterales bacterium]